MKRLIPISFIILFAIIGCTERIDVDLGENYTRLVVDGNIADDTGSYVVNLTKTADYFSNEPTPRVVNAQVLLNDGTDTWALNETNPGVSGIYETDSTFSGVIGNTYTLDIILDQEIDNRTRYQASCEIMKVARIDSIAVEFRDDWGEKGFWEIKLWAQEPGDQINYYMFHYYRNGILMTDSIWKVNTADDAYFNGNYINGISVFYINNKNYWESFLPGDVVTLQMSGITKEYFDFIYQVQLSGYNIPFFTGPPANVQGNISDGGIGFFAAYSNSWGTCVVP